MGRNLDDIIENLPAKRQTKIATLSKQKIEEMIAHAATLSDFRKAVGETQAEVAEELASVKTPCRSLKSALTLMYPHYVGS
jgi:hypothetical protein